MATGRTARTRAKAPAERPEPQAASHAAVLAKGTAVRMLAGIYTGYTGHVASVRVLAGPRPNATYTLVLEGPDGRRARTTVKHTSLGRTWAVT